MGFPSNDETGCADVTDNITKFIMDTMVADTTLNALTESKYRAEYPRTDMLLNGTSKTVVGVVPIKVTTTSYFMSLYREQIKTEADFQIVVLCGKGQTDAYCWSVVNRIHALFQDASYVGTYRVFVNSVSEEVKPDQPYMGNWLGTLDLNLTAFDPIK